MRTIYHQKNKTQKRGTYNNMVYVLLVVLVVVEITLHPIRMILGGVATPIQGIGQGIAISFEGLGSFFTAKPALERENKLLEEENEALRLELNRSGLYQQENQALRSLLRVQEEEGAIKVAQVIAHPPATAYDTLLIRISKENPVSVGTPIFSGAVYIGDVEEVAGNTALVRLVTSDTLVQDVYVGEKSVLLTGTGGGTFEVTVPKGFEITQGQIISHVRFPTQPFAKVELIEADEVQAVQRVYLQALFSLHTIRYVNF